MRCRPASSLWWAIAHWGKLGQYRRISHLLLSTKLAWRIEPSSKAHTLPLNTIKVKGWVTVKGTFWVSNRNDQKWSIFNKIYYSELVFFTLFVFWFKTDHFWLFRQKHELGTFRRLKSEVRMFSFICWFFRFHFVNDWYHNSQNDNNNDDN